MHYVKSHAAWYPPFHVGLAFDCASCDGLQFTSSAKCTLWKQHVAPAGSWHKPFQYSLQLDVCKLYFVCSQALP